MAELSLSPAGSDDPMARTPAPLREDLALYQGPRTPEGAPTWTLHDPLRNAFFSIGEPEFELLRRWGSGALGIIVAGVKRETPLAVSPSQVLALERFLDLNQLMRVVTPAATKRLGAIARATRQGVGAWLLHRYLFFRIPLVHPDRFLTRTLPFLGFVFTRRFAVLVGLISVLGLYLVTRQWDTFTSTFLHFFSLDGLAVFVVALLFTKLVHELGHGYTAKRFGLKVPTMGIAFLVMWPVLYTDVTDAWKLVSRRQRMAVGAAGMLAELGLAGVATLLWSFLPDGPARSAAFFIATVSWTMTLLINANPFMRWDGYYVLSDYWGIQNLHERASALGRWRLREWVLGLGDPPPEPFPPPTARMLVVFAYATWAYRLILFIGIALLVYHFFFKLAGIVLMTVELAWFVARPVYRELASWMKRRGDIAWNRRTRRTALLLVMLTAFTLVPWNSRISVPALLMAEAHRRLFAPLPSRIRAVQVSPGDHVEEGQVLAVLEAPDLDHRLQQAESRVRVLRPQLAMRTAHETLREYRLVLEQELAENLAEFRGHRDQRTRLTITAPFPGRVVDMDDTLRPGRWVNETTPLMSLVDQNTAIVEARLDEDDLARIDIGDRGRFYPDNLDIPAVDVEVREIDRSSLTTVDKPYFASVYGGGVPVRQHADGGLVPHQARYRLRLDIAETPVVVSQITRGTVRLEGDARSLIERLWRSLIAVLIRESGF